MRNRTQHRLRCLLALGYPVNWIATQTGLDPYLLADYHRHANPGPLDGAETLDALYERLGERAATHETTGLGKAEIGDARRHAQRRGYLPPMAYEQDEDGNDVNPDPTAVYRAVYSNGRTPDRVALDRLSLIRLLLLKPEVGAAEGAMRLGLGSNYQRELRPLLLSELREHELPSVQRRWVRPDLCKAILAVTNAVAIGVQDPIDAWGRVLSMFLYATEMQPQRLPVEECEHAADVA